MMYQKLEYLLISILEEAGPNDVLFQQNRMPHLHKAVMTLLHQKIAQEWIGRGGSITLSPSLPDLTPHNLFFCGYIKDVLYVSPLTTTLLELSGTIKTAVATVTLDLLSNMRTDITCKHDICQATYTVPVDCLQM
jgi:hypothetical protein